MGIIRNPKSFSEHFGISSESIDRLGILNPMLNIDTKLFIDPILLDASGRQEISQQATNSFNLYFEDVIKLLGASRTRGDLPWRTARARFRIREVRATCLGYGVSGIDGYAIGPDLAEKLTATAKEIVDLGITDPNLIKLLPLLEEGIGPDLISDLTASVILKDLYKLTESVCRKMRVPTQKFRLGDEAFQLPLNPFAELPVVLVPRDILRALPIATDWSEVDDVVSHNAALRQRVNALIGAIWQRTTRRERKELLRRRALESRSGFETLLEVIGNVDASPYDLEGDPKGLVTWHKVRESIANLYPLELRLTGPQDAQAAIEIVRAIIERFRVLIEAKGIWKDLWDDGKPRSEKNSQMIFFAVADAYCHANNLDVTPEAETGAGPVDFKFSRGYAIRIIVEIKHSNSSRLITGYTNQLETYSAAESPVCAFYLVMDVGMLGRRAERLMQIKNSKPEGRQLTSEIVFVDARRRPSASRR